MYNMLLRQYLLNSASKLTASLAQIILKIGLICLIGRFYGPQIMGIWAILMVISGLCLPLVALGINNYAVFAIAKGHFTEDQVLSEQLKSGFIGYCAALISSLGLLVVLGYSSWIIIAALIVNASLIFEAISFNVQAIFDGKQRMGVSSLISLLGDIFQFVSILAAVFLKLDFIFALVGLTISKVVNSMAAMWIFYRFTGSIPNINTVLRSRFNITRKAIPFACDNFIVLGYNRSDVLLLSKYCTSELIGIYNAAAIIVLRLNTIIKPFIAAYAPILAERFNSNNAQFTTNVKIGLKYLLLSAMPVLWFILIYSDHIIIFLYGNKFLDSISIIELLSLMIIFKFINPFLANLFSLSEHQTTRMVITIAALLINIVLNLYLIPIYNIYGCVFSSIVTEAFITFSIMILLSKYKIWRVWRDVKDLLFFVLMSAIIMAIGWYFKEMGSLVVMPIFVIGIVSLCVFLRLVSKKEIMLIIHAVVNKKPAAQ